MMDLVDSFLQVFGRFSTDPAPAVLLYLLLSICILLPYAWLRARFIIMLERKLSSGPRISEVIMGFIHIPLTVLPILVFLPMFPLTIYLFREGKDEKRVAKRPVVSPSAMPKSKQRIGSRKDGNRPIGGSKVLEGMLLDLDPVEDKAAIKIARMFRNRIFD
jgi:hypothetical protein